MLSITSDPAFTATAVLLLAAVSLDLRFWFDCTEALSFLCTFLFTPFNCSMYDSAVSR